MAKLRVLSFVLGPLDTNCYLAYDEDSLEAMIVDPAEPSDEVVRWVDKLGLKVRYIVATHGHFDHIYGAEELRRILGASFAMSTLDTEVAQLSYSWARHLLGEDPGTPPTPDIDLDKVDVLRFGGCEMRVIKTPGHTPGSVTLFLAGALVAFTGDTIFSGTVGRTDLPGGSEEQLMMSLCRLAKTLPRNTLLYPGHGFETTLNRELRLNIFLEEALRHCGGWEREHG